MTSLLLRSMIEVSSRAIETIFNATGEILPMYDIVTANNQQYPFVPPSFRNNQEKDVVIELVRREFKRLRVMRYVFIAEAWTLDRPAITREQAMCLLPSEQPDRIEIVAFTAEDRLAGMASAQRLIIRKVNSRARLGPLTHNDSIEMEGRMVGLLFNEGRVQ